MDRATIFETHPAHLRYLSQPFRDGKTVRQQSQWDSVARG